MAFWPEASQQQQQKKKPLLEYKKRGKVPKSVTFTSHCFQFAQSILTQMTHPQDKQMRLNQILVSLWPMKGDSHRESLRFPFLLTAALVLMCGGFSTLSICGPGVRHTRCGGGDFGGVPAQLAQLGPRKEGGRWDSPPGTQPVCRVGRGGAGQPG